jgi:BirA family biotin operon repressor/biotin-[acetyl-CoA-carboxylase] ligase
MSLLLDESAISHALGDSYWRVSVVDETPSTQTMLRDSTPKHGDVIVAEYQTHGRGRLDRTFEAQPSTALLFSLYVEPQTSIERFTFIPLLAGLVVTQTINENCAPGFMTKWPNDIRYGEKKVGGLLVERCGDGVIVGVGINVSMTETQLPVSTATSILLATGSVPNRNQLLADFLTSFALSLARWADGKDFTSEYIDLNATIQREIEITLPGGAITRGRAVGVDATGALILESGELITVGDVVHVR